MKGCILGNLKGSETVEKSAIYLALKLILRIDKESIKLVEIFVRCH